MDEHQITLQGIPVSEVKQQIETTGDLDGKPAAVALVNIESLLFSVQLQYVHDHAPSRRAKEMSVALARHTYEVGLTLDSERLREDAAAVLVRVVGPSKAARIVQNVRLEQTLIHKRRLQ